MMINKRVLMSLIVLSGMTQRTLAESIGISKSTLNRKINGYADFGSSEMAAICDALNILDPKEKAQIFLASSSQIGDEKSA